jgi:4-hydroxy-tetrahydrodipicolinate synthase
MDFLEGGKFVQSIKYGCELAGLRTGGVRAPLTELDEQDKQILQKIIGELKLEVASAIERTG